MNIFSIQFWHPLPAVFTGALLAVVVGCSSANLGNIDESEDARENMASPGVLSNEQGESPLTLKTGKDREPTQQVVASAPVTDEQTEFEQFKKWDHLRTNDPDSPEYQEFLEWQKYQKFKAGQ